MTIVRDLQPGDIVSLNTLESSGVFISSSDHPKYQGLALVVWVIYNSRSGDNFISLDALSWAQDIGMVTPPQSPDSRLRTLETAIREAK